MPKPNSREFLEELLVEAKQHLPSWLYSSLLSAARARAGGKASGKARQSAAAVKKDRIGRKPDGKPGEWAIQSLIFSADKFTEAEAKQWIKEHDNFGDYGVDETEESFRFRQYDPEHFSKFRNSALTEGIIAVHGRIGEAVTKELLPDVPARGPLNAPIAFVGASLDRIEKARQEPFVGIRGRCFIEKYLKPLGLTKGDAYLTNIVPLSLTDDDGSWRDPHESEIAEWRDSVVKDLCEASPAVIVALGKTASAVLGDHADITLPHPGAVVRFGDRGEVNRKLGKVKRLIKARKAPPLARVKISKSMDEKQIVYGVVLDPYGNKGQPEVDAHRDWMSPGDVEKTAHEFQKGERVIGIEHAIKANAEVVETYLVPYPTRDDYLKAMHGEDHSIYRQPFGDDFVHSGSWILGVQFGPREWDMFKAGVLNAFSPHGFGVRVPLKKAAMPKVKVIELVPK